jgi:hypothetical protein
VHQHELVIARGLRERGSCLGDMLDLDGRVRSFSSSQQGVAAQRHHDSHLLSLHVMGQR